MHAFSNIDYQLSKMQKTMATEQTGVNKHFRRSEKTLRLMAKELGADKTLGKELQELSRKIDAVCHNSPHLQSMEELRAPLHEYILYSDLTKVCLFMLKQAAPQIYYSENDKLIKAAMTRMLRRITSNYDNLIRLHEVPPYAQEENIRKEFSQAQEKALSIPEEIVTHFKAMQVITKDIESLSKKLIQAMENDAIAPSLKRKTGILTSVRKQNFALFKSLPTSVVSEGRAVIQENFRAVLNPEYIEQMTYTKSLVAFGPQMAFSKFAVKRLNKKLATDAASHPQSFPTKTKTHHSKHIHFAEQNREAQFLRGDDPHSINRRVSTPRAKIN